MIEYKMVRIDERKAEIIKTLSNAPNADHVVPMQDRIIIADLIVAGVEKVMQTINAHLDMSAPVLRGQDSVQALVMMQCMEVGVVMDGIVKQMGMMSLEAILAMGMGEELTDEMRRRGMPQHLTLADLLKMVGM